jgi:WD40 repeat protein
MNHLSQLENGIDSWNRWRLNHAEATCHLAGEDLSHGYFFEGNFRRANLRGVNFRRACLIGADLSGADLSGADLTGAYLGDANLYGANLSHANLTEANLDRADLRCANLLGTKIAEADIRTAQLPDPNVDPYTDLWVSSLSQAQANIGRQQIALPIIPGGSSTHVAQIAAQIEGSKIKASVQSDPRLVTAAVRQSLLQQMRLHLQSLTHESPEAAVLRQQAIRQSAAPVALKALAQQKAEIRSKVTAGPAQGIAPNKPLAQRRLAQQGSGLLSVPTVPLAEGRRAWGRRQMDKRLSARVRRRLWVPAVAASVCLAVGLSLGLVNLDSQQVVAQSQTATAFALAKSLVGSSQVWAVATAQNDRSNWVIGGGANGQIEIWDGQTGEMIRAIAEPSQGIAAHKSGVRSLAVSTSGQWLVSGGNDGLKVWKLGTGTLVHSIPEITSPVESVAISPDEKTFISSDQEGSITAWDLSSGEQLYSFDNGAPVWSIAIAPNGKSFVGGSDDLAVRQWDLASGKLLKEFAGHEDAVHTVAISPDGKILASGSNDSTVKLWDLATGSLQTTLSGHGDGVVSLAISSDGKTLASGSDDSTVKLWDLPSYQLSETLSDPSNLNRDGLIFAVAFDPQGQVLVSGDQDKTVKVWQ